MDRNCTSSSTASSITSSVTQASYSHTLGGPQDPRVAANEAPLPLDRNHIPSDTTYSATQSIGHSVSRQSTHRRPPWPKHGYYTPHSATHSVTQPTYSRSLASSHGPYVEMALSHIRNTQGLGGSFSQPTVAPSGAPIAHG